MMPVLFFDPGQFTARLDLEQPQPSPDGHGGAEISWSIAATLWARIEPVTAGFEEVAGQIRGTFTHRIWIRARDSVAEGMRFRKGVRTFTIRAIRDPDDSRRYLVCLCQEDAL
jgi:SPP1 family predicted phage head-tail adaptor